jgi:hypothetical protein
MKEKIQLFILMMFLLTSQSFAQEKFNNTLSYNDSIASPEANLEVISWLAGHWRGEAFGGITEEVWSPPLGGSMMGAFKLVVNGKVNFYELETILEVDNTLILKLKHFNVDLTGWEEKDDTVDFRLVKVTADKIYFDGFTLERISDDEINMYVVIEDGGQQSEVKFNYKKVKN